MDSHQNNTDNLHNRDPPKPMPSHDSDIQTHTLSNSSSTGGGGDLFNRRSCGGGDGDRRYNKRQEDNVRGYDGCVIVGFVILVVLMAAFYGTCYYGFHGQRDRHGNDGLECKDSSDCHNTDPELSTFDLVESPSDKGKDISTLVQPTECLSPQIDQNGIPDLALESLGGLILSIRETQIVPSKVRTTFLGIPITATSPPPPETIIRIRFPLSPGDCWAFQGSKGNVIVQLSKPTAITGVHLEHIHKKMDPDGRLGSAPKEFQIWGLGNYRCLKVSTPRVLLGTFTFEPTKTPLQYFPIQTSNQNETFNQIELEVLSNHGDDITCIYRLRVHGVINSTAASVEIEKSEELNLS